MSDRIAIISRGELRCFGSPLFLKKHYGVGYYLVLVVERTCNSLSIVQLIQNHVPRAKLVDNMGDELAFILPHDDISSYKFLFSEFETNGKNFGILSYGITATSLEEVCMCVYLCIHLQM